MAHTTRKLLWVTVVLSVMGTGAPGRADTVRVAVAANFAGTLEKLARAFESATGHRVLPSPASSGQLYAQIRAGAPFDVFMSADATRPAQLEQDGLTDPGSRFVYARGRLVLWSRKPEAETRDGRALQSKNVGAVALPDPRTAPYGAAARTYLQRQGLWQTLEDGGHIAISSSVTHAYQFVATGASELGFVALSQVLNGSVRGSYWVVPTDAGALDQQAVLLRRSAQVKAAHAWLAFVARDAKARSIIEHDGYEVP